MMYYFDKRAQRILHKDEAAVGNLHFLLLLCYCMLLQCLLLLLYCLLRLIF